MNRTANDSRRAAFPGRAGLSVQMAHSGSSALRRAVIKLVRSLPVRHEMQAKHTGWLSAGFGRTRA